MANELTLIHGVPPDCDEREYLRELQNALLWINFRYYLAPLFWLVVGGSLGACDTCWLCIFTCWQSGWLVIKHRSSVSSQE